MTQQAILQEAALIRSDAEALEVARQLAAEFAVEAGVRDRERRLPWAELARYSASGLGGITVPRQYGGAGVSLLTLSRVFRILCAADPSLGQIPQNHFAVLELFPLLATPAQLRFIYSEVLSGRRLGNAGPEKGKQPMQQLSTRLSREADGLYLSGQRFYSTGALFADWIPTRARDESGLTVQVLVPRHAPGVEVIDDWSSFGQRTTASGSVRFERVRVEEAQLLPVWQLADRPNLTGPISQLIQASIDAGIAEAALRDAILFVREHARPWLDSGVSRASDDPYVIQAVARLQIDLHAAQEVLDDAARTLDQLRTGEVTDAISAEASIAVAEAKVLTTEIALQASEKLFELAGSASTRARHQLDRHWRNARVHTLHDPVRWKYHAIGNYSLNGVFPARHQWN
ncbi:SfnB family sulfur acquisition oxidoreductase [Aquitalea sp. LB_tupeE]|uniref:SfnB family sulfur acquisition oxidoreductase n=1 Tax=Aquitalea sp. LB_tupeE TaxID=2748078 RepID=UPI0021035146|nr:SfnB family sulfur acquisition oxidoreductase [Aquitalea sp. LB_tupeE]